MASKKTVILVDDDITILKIGCKALAEFYNVISLNSGTRLLKMLKATVGTIHHPDLILLDIDMPEMSGYETMSHIKENEVYKKIPLIFLSGKDGNENELKGLALGAVDYVAKPFSVDHLLKRIKLHI